MRFNIDNRPQAACGRFGWKANGQTSRRYVEKKMCSIIFYFIYFIAILLLSEMKLYLLSEMKQSIKSYIFLQNVSGSGKDMGLAYVNFTRNAMDQIRSKVNDELWILNFFEVS